MPRKIFCMHMKKSTHRPDAPGTTRCHTGCTGSREETTLAGWPVLMAVGVENSGHSSDPLWRYVFSSRLRGTYVGLCQFWHEKMRVLDLDGSRYAPRHPVLDALCAAPLVNRNQLRDLGRPPKSADQFSVMRRCSHGPY